MRTNRQKAIEREFETMVSTADRAIAQLSTAVAQAELLIPWLHDNLINSKGDVVEANRVDLAASFTEQFTKLQELNSKLLVLFDLHDDDAAVYAAKLDSYLTENPSTLTQAEARFK